MRTKPAGFIAIYENDDGTSVPYGWDQGCEGALECGSSIIAVFPTEKAGKDAIKISANLAKLQKSKGDAFDFGFLPPSRRRIKIYPIAIALPASAPKSDPVPARHALK